LTVGQRGSPVNGSAEAAGVTARTNAATRITRMILTFGAEAPEASARWMGPVTLVRRMDR
jgi:hypothetical protein